MRMTPLDRLISVEEARGRLLRAVVPIQRTERIPLERSGGRVSARTLRAPRPVPSFVRATWDGYAFRAAGTRGAAPRRTIRLRVVAELHAEERLARPLRPGECVAIATGAPLPRGADTVEIFENVRTDGNDVLLTSSVPPGNCLAEPGEDLRRGQLLLRAGEVLTPARIGAVGATGASSVVVFERPTVALVPNGNELVAPGGRLSPGRVHEFNNLTLGALVQACGGVPFPLPPVPDDPSMIEGTLEGALRQADLVLVTGGSSVGERDYLPAVFPRVGRLLFHGIKVRPGKPTLAAKAGTKLLVGMPGHPTSCLSNGFWLLLPLLRKLARLPGDGLLHEKACLARAWRAPSSGFATVVPVHLEGGWATPTFHGSSAITSLTDAQGFLMLRPSQTHLARGSKVEVLRLPSPLA